jgi:hypothetical protein
MRLKQERVLMAEDKTHRVGKSCGCAEMQHQYNLWREDEKNFSLVSAVGFSYCDVNRHSGIRR